MSTIADAQTTLWRALLGRELSGKSAEIEQIDVVRSGDEVVAWFYFGDDDEFAVGFKMEQPMPDEEIRRALTEFRVLH